MEGPRMALVPFDALWTHIPVVDGYSILVDPKQREIERTTTEVVDHDLLGSPPL